MDIQYVGHSCFRLRGKEGIVITDPFSPSIGFAMPKLSADIITVSHSHFDHNNVLSIKGTAQRPAPFIIDHAGEYEVSDISVYGHASWHDDSQGSERGENIMFSIYLDGVHILHLGDLGHPLDEKTLQNIEDVDVLLCPVGGQFTISPSQAVEVISSLEPTVVIPMHFRTPEHDTAQFADLAPLEDFIKVFGKTATPTDKFSISANKTDEETETQLVILQAKQI